MSWNVADIFWLLTLERGDLKQQHTLILYPFQVYCRRKQPMSNIVDVMFIVDSLTNQGPLDGQLVLPTVRQSIVDSTYRQANRPGNSQNREGENTGMVSSAG